MKLLSITPWTRVNDDFLDGSIDYQEPDLDVSHPLLQQDCGPDVWKTQNYFYQHVALDIVSESVFHYPYPLITEKTLRPIANQRMFIIIGAAGTLGALQRKGFMTWGDIIDETYDTLTEPRARFKSVMTAIQDFCRRDLTEVKQYLEQNQYRLTHNLRNLRDLRQRELDQLIKKLDQ